MIAMVTIGEVKFYNFKSLFQLNNTYIHAKIVNGGIHGQSWIKSHLRL